MKQIIVAFYKKKMCLLIEELFRIIHTSNLDAFCDLILYAALLTKEYCRVSFIRFFYALITYFI